MTSTAIAALLVTAPGATTAAPRNSLSSLGSSIAAARNADGRLELFVVDGGGGVFHRRQINPGGGWSGWEKLDGVLRP
ncbi:hypothetical protein GCM10020221_03450 [Streptomyces thioluteus]|uniref:PLL-like beta propeller domain-containing protein n=1 Tax=Streptomyces thioluteus TaxID=66431 RepID=A0ABP6IVA7_STRTU